MSSDCVIRFDHPNDVYHSGEDLNGSVVLTTSASQTVRAVHITINGYAKVRWMERRKQVIEGQPNTYYTTYTARDQYLSSRSYLVGAEGGASFELAPGTYNHTFSCSLPQTIPTSVTGKHGEIKYEVVVTVDRPYRFDNVFKKAFTVIQDLNLNYDPLNRTPKQTDSVKHFRRTCCCFGGAGVVNSKLSIPFGGYAPGQKIKFELLVENESGNDLPGCKVKLDQRITFEAREPFVKEKYSNSILDSKAFPKVKWKSTKHFDGELLIPSVPPSSTYAGECIRIDYTVYADIETGCCNSNFRLVIPIVIGTIPIIESATNPASVIIRQPTGPKTANGETDPPPDFRFAAPPSFEDSMAAHQKFDDDERDDKHKEAPYAPKYPMYHNFAQPPSAPSSNGHSAMTTQQQMPSASSVTYGWNTHNN